MKFNGITKKGREYLAKIQSLNKPINFSKIKIGDGLLDNYDNPSELIDLQNFKIEKGILELNQENETVILKTNIDNVNLQTGYYPREIGVFVNDDGQELMYYYMNDGDETSWIPPESDGPFRIDLKINLIATNTTSIVVPNSGKELYITKEFLVNNYTKNGSFLGTAGDLENRIIGLAGKQNGKFPLNSAIKGNVYLLEQTQKFYVCTQNYSGTTISVPNANFTELSVYENMNRLENLIKTDNYGAQNGGYFELFDRVIIYGSFNYLFGKNSVQNFEIRESLRNWQHANVICSWREINQSFSNITVSGIMTSPTTLSIKSNVASSGRGTVSYLIITRT